MGVRFSGNILTRIDWEIERNNKKRSSEDVTHVIYVERRGAKCTISSNE